MDMGGWTGSKSFLNMRLTNFRERVQISSIQLTDDTNIGIREFYEQSLSKRANLSSLIVLYTHIPGPAGFTGLRLDGHLILYEGYAVFILPEPEMLELGGIFSDLMGGNLNCMAMGDTSSFMREQQMVLHVTIFVSMTNC
jgi:hypothetical protein